MALFIVEHAKLSALVRHSIARLLLEPSPGRWHLLSVSVSLFFLVSDGDETTSFRGPAKSVPKPALHRYTDTPVLPTVCATAACRRISVFRLCGSAYRWISLADRNRPTWAYFPGARPLRTCDGVSLLRYTDTPVLAPVNASAACQRIGVCRFCGSAYRRVSLPDRRTSAYFPSARLLRTSNDACPLRYIDTRSLHRSVQVRRVGVSACFPSALPQPAFRLMSRPRGLERRIGVSVQGDFKDTVCRHAATQSWKATLPG